MLNFLDFANCYMVGYVGPGAGLSMMGALSAVAAVLMLAMIGPILYPIKLLRGWLRQRRMQSVVLPDQQATIE